MIDILDKTYCPTLEEITSYVRNPIFMDFCLTIKTQFQSNEKIEFSSCSWIRGWNIKFKKASKTLCTIYPRESYFTIMIVISKKEKEQIESILPECTTQLQEIYHQTKEGNNQRWLMIDLEDHSQIYDDVIRFIKIRRDSKS